VSGKPLLVSLEAQPLARRDVLGRRRPVIPSVRRPPSDHAQALVERGGSPLKSTRVAGLAAGIAFCLPATAVAADVSVRVEGAADTLVPRTQVSTPAGPVSKDGTNSCAGSSAAGALEAATGGDWAGTWSGSFGYSVDRIRSESYPFSSAPSGSYWSFWINHRPAQTGICGATLSTGDEVLFFPDCYGAGCVNPAPLKLSAPPTASRGQPFKATVTELVPSGTTVVEQPAAGASVSTGSAAYTTAADGTVDIPAQTGDITLRATKADRVRSATETVCVTSGVDGRCGSPLDRTAPRVEIFTPDRRAYDRGPRRIAGQVSADPSGLRHVKLRLNRRHEGRCYAYGSRAERFRGVSCGEGWWFSIGDREQWSYLLPERLPAGRYVLQAVAIDGSGNRSRVRTRLNRMKFRVR
jgi:hypothetical protein